MSDVSAMRAVDGRTASALAGRGVSDGAALRSLATVKLFGFASSAASPSLGAAGAAAADRARRDAENAAADDPPSRGRDVRYPEIAGLFTESAMAASMDPLRTGTCGRVGGARAAGDDDVDDA
jgi:hypothetical protein